MPNLGETLIILFIVLLVFGAAKMPVLGDRFGRFVLQLRGQSPGAAAKSTKSQKA